MKRCNLIVSPGLVLAAVMLSGCTMFRGAPEVPFDKSIYKDAKFKMTATDIDDLIKAANESARNLQVNKFVAAIDLRYLAFRNDVVANRKHFGAGTSFLALVTNIVGTLTKAAAAKTNYAAFGSFLTGTQAVVDSNYLFDQTLLGLVSKMDANRAATLISIRERLSKPLDEYPGSAAFGDVANYYNSGTLVSAVQAVQQSAAAEAEEKQADLRAIHVMTPAQIEDRRNLTTAVITWANNPANQERVLKVLADRKVAGVDAYTPPAQRSLALIRLYQKLAQDSEEGPLIAEMKAAGNF